MTEKQLMENTVTHKKLVELSESRGDVITFFLPHHDPSSCVLDCLQSFDLSVAVHLGDYRNSLTRTELGRLLQPQLLV